MNEKLKFISKNDDVSVYSVGSDNLLKRYVVSTKPTRSLCLDAGVVSNEYGQLLFEGMVNVLNNLPEKDELSEVDSKNISTLNIKTGGDAWWIKSALKQSYGLDIGVESITRTKRFRDKSGKFHTNILKNDINPIDNANIYFGDIVASGVSLEANLNLLFEGYEGKGSIDRIVFFTIGGIEAEKKISKVINDYNNKPEEVIIVYLESRFAVANEKTNLRIKEPLTDLIVPGSLPAPEYILEELSSLSYVLEKCKAYYGSKRYFRPKEHFEELKEYWSELKKEAENGFTMYDALSERMISSPSLTNFNKFESDMNKIWLNVDKEVLFSIWEQHNELFHKDYFPNIKTSKLLISECDNRLIEIELLAKKYK